MNGHQAVEAGDDRLAKIEAMLAEVLARLDRPATPSAPRRLYSVKEAADLLDRTPYTVREWCRHRRINGVKVAQRCGATELWAVPSEEVERIRNEGLLPLPAR